MLKILFIILLFLLFYNIYLFLNKYRILKKSNSVLFESNFFVKYIFLFLSCFVVLLGFLDLKWGYDNVKGYSNGIDIVVVLDVSKSMNALDFYDGKYQYSRLDAAKSMLSNFVVKHSNDRFGLVVFAGDAISVCPLTLDHDTFLTFLENVDYKNLTEQGTNLEKAISLGIDRFSLSEDRSKVLLLISDGGDEDNVVDYSFVSKIRDKYKIESFVVGVGTEKGSKIPAGQTMFGDVYYEQYNNKDVVVRLNEGTLKSLAKALNGSYLMVDSLDGLGKFDKEIDKIEKKVLENYVSGDGLDISRYIAMLSFLFFTLYIIIWIFEDYLFYNGEKNGSKK